jgi:class 3 adenylate cyclase
LARRADERFLLYTRPWKLAAGEQGTSLSTEHVGRRLMAILAADVAGYSRLMGTDEEGTLARLKELQHALVEPRIADHRGRAVKTTGRPHSRMVS